MLAAIIYYVAFILDWPVNELDCRNYVSWRKFNVYAGLRYF